MRKSRRRQTTSPAFNVGPDASASGRTRSGSGRVDAPGRFVAGRGPAGLQARHPRSAPYQVNQRLHQTGALAAYGFRESVDLVAIVHLRDAGNRASSAESVGEFWFGQVAKCVIQSDFQCPGGAEPIRPFGDHSGLSVEAFDNATGELPPGSEPVQNQVAVRAQPCGQPPSSGRAASASSGCTSGRGTGRPSTATRSPTAIESPP